MEIRIREATERDILAIKDRLRAADQAEVIAAGNASGEDSLRRSFARSTLSYTVDLDGTPVGMFGIVPESLVGERANVWFLGTDDLSRMKKSFVKLSRKVIANFLLEYPCLWNVVDGRYTAAIRWLKSCGAQFQETPIKLSGVDFYGFVIRRA